MTPLVTEAVLRAVVGEALRDEPPPKVIAVSADPSWSGAAEFEVENHLVDVVPCISVLAAREALAARTAEPNGDERITLLLTNRSNRELGEEVIARVWRHQVQNPRGWDQLKQLFRVDTLDSALADERWLVDLLIHVAPPRGYAPPSSGYLSRDAAWSAFRKHALRITVESPTLGDLLLWAGSDEAESAVSLNLGSHASDVATALVREKGPVAGHVFRLIEVGRGPDSIPLGLVADALWGHVDESSSAVLHARVRFEHAVGAKHISGEVARAWANSATQVVDDADQRGQGARIVEWLDRAEDILIDFDAIDLASGSSVLPQAFQARLTTVGSAIQSFLDSPHEDQLDRVDVAVRQVRDHRQSATAERERTARVEMALRLCRRLLRQAKAPATDLATLAHAFVQDGAWVDHARDALGEGETIAELSGAYKRLIEDIDDLRRQRDRAFGRALAAWAKSPSLDSDSVRPIERVLDEIVAPIAEEHPVLLLVLDGLSHAEAIKLQQDIRDLGWKSRTPAGRPLPPTIAAFPTITVVSRATLLTGQLCDGGPKVEAEGFASHQRLRAVSADKPPVLFHKKDLKVEGGEIAPSVRQAILDPERRIVGVVVNAVDDHLDKGSQLRLADGLRALRPLRPLLDVASEADRVVVLASDHGHILEHGSTVKPHEGSGERWRPADSDPMEDEVRLEGPRVIADGSAIVVPATETIRYVPFEKRGYHGGATPQEVLCPLVVLFTGGKSIAGWETLPILEPAWWNRAPEPAVQRAARPEVEAVVEPSGQASFLAPDGELVTSAAERSGWIMDLLQSSLWASQQEAAGRAALDDESAAQILSLFDESGGVVPSAALARQLQVSATRARGKLEALKRVLNFDGYGVLTVEVDGTGRLDFSLLETQFGISR